MLEAAADKAGLGGVLDKAKELGQNAIGPIFQKAMEKVVTETLEWLGPEAGKIAAAKMAEKYSTVRLSQQETAVKAASEAIVQFKDLMMDFCGDAVENPQTAFTKVSVLLFRACNAAADRAVRSTLSTMAGGCACCIKACANVEDLIEKVKEVIQASLKENVVKTLHNKMVPKQMTDKLVWGKAEDDIGEPKNKSSPQQQEMP